MLGGIQTSIMTAVNSFLDLLSSPAELNYYHRLREEADLVFTTGDEWGNQASVGKLNYTDSAIRESLRRSPVITRTGIREVLQKDGLNMPNGQKIPKGAWLSIPAAAVHYDERFYPKAQTYNPFRFVPDAIKDQADVKVATDSPKPAEGDKTSTKQRKNQGLSTTSETYLPFGYGRHSWCVPRRNLKNLSL